MKGTFRNIKRDRSTIFSLKLTGEEIYFYSSQSLEIFYKIKKFSMSKHEYKSSH